ncbi:ankyrin repeat domain-containing protein [Bremerella cremea]|uniref:Ankyrin repeat domain-containing protein n=1 Tax=Bremerella cremea TaxID=1031537 RepID=A0A368KMX1_9BACT|nr:ankyrin repeat domain-containing protein [Bremerella cremea]RCS44194.1 ankyrin repeat domain-containing protein [Bremerella cremea]
MFLEPLEKYHALPRVLTANDSLFREQARANWARFVKRLRKPRRLDDHFFLIVEIDSQIIYLDQVSWFNSKLAGRDALEQVYRSFPEEYARENVIDFGYLENGLVKESHWLTAVYFSKYDPDDICDDFVLPAQMELPSELYEHYLAIAQHDPSAIERMGQFSLAEIHSVPFRMTHYYLDEFCPLGYAVACENIAYVTAAHGQVQFADCRSYLDLGLSHLAMIYGSCAMLQSVLAGGGVINDLNEDGYTPLEFAVGHRKLEHVDCLLSHGADPNFGIAPSVAEVEHAVTLKEMTPSMYQRLRDAGTRFDLRENHYLWTPLHYNAKRFRRDTFIQMVRDGLNPYAEDYEGETPFDKLRKDVPEEIFQEVYRSCLG